MVKLVEFFKPPGERPHLDEVWINPDAVVSIRPERSGLIEEAYDFGIDRNVEFSKLAVNESGFSRQIIVIGSPNEVRDKLNKKQLLRD